MVNDPHADRSILKSVLDAVTETVILLDTGGTVLAINEAAAARLGRRVEEMVGRDICDFLPPETVAYRRPIVQRVLETGQPVCFEDSHSGRRIASRVYPAFDAQGHVAALAIYGVDVTDQQATAEALRRSQETYRLLVQHAGEGILVGQDGKIVFANPKLIEIAGFPEEEVLSRRFVDLVHPDDRQMAMEHHLRRQSGQELSATYRARTVDKAGRTKWVEVHAVQMTWNGRPASLGMVTDVTERRLAEQALRDSEARLASAVDAAALGTFEMDVLTKEVFIDDRLRQMSGIPPEAEPRAFEYWMENLHPDDRDLAAAVRRRLVDGQCDHLSTEVRFRHPDKGWIWLNYHARVVERDGQGRSVRHIGVFQDITDRKVAEQVLRQTELRFQLAVRGSNDGLWDWPDMTQDPQWWSPRFYELLGYKDGEIEASSSAWRSLVHPDDLDRVLAAVHAVSEFGEPLEVEYRLRTKSGVYRWFCGRGAVSSNLEGRQMRMSGSLRDITDLRKVQTERLTYQSRLKSLTSKLAMAEESERRRIAIGVHDDIGQKLVLAKLELQSLCQTPPEPATAQVLGRVCDLIDQAMQDARSLAFELSNPVLYEVGLSAAVESWLSRQMKAGIACEFSSELEGIRLDLNTSVVLFQAVREVVTNAVKHARASLLEVEILRPDGEVRILVRDNGVGFDPSILDRSGDRQAGLGLFSVMERLEYIQGRVQICSAPGQGATVILTAPFKAAPPPRRRAAGV
jgi:PAS domain S-box-containing protein